ncbi:hypothetical protein [Kribbella sp. VKM Ac-2568]|uniref:hypothetical protein n=1 Tax=Kribbella sp. VKM Ac-2568 TaxID=2512219 RepID=UPI00104B8349|nr:hypothetical protein [Kribbella sp. VKM Ac-2568]TCM43442.1 hypothetical protein EV648_10961 [Kribbella sp. VKM Ac-2568]
MIRRPLLPAAALCATLALAACNNSPEAGRPDTTPTSTTATPTASPTPKYTAEEEAAITAAKSRYVAARGAIDIALSAPEKSKRADLENAGNGGNWLIGVVDDVEFQRKNGWYQAGKVQVTFAGVTSVTLLGQQPRVTLKVCVDASKTSTLFQKTKKPVPMGPSDGNRHLTESVLVYAPPTGKTTKMWFLIDEKATGSC